MSVEVELVAAISRLAAAHERIAAAHERLASYALDRGSRGDDRYSITDAVIDLGRATQRIAHGDVDGACGLEGLAMAIAGQGIRATLADAVVEGMDRIAQSIEERAL